MSDDSTAVAGSPESRAHKRNASAAGLENTGATRAVKRRASKACQCCRARKVRCNVTEHGAPCTNCRLDEVECVVSESRRKRKWSKDGEARTQAQAQAPPAGQGYTAECGNAEAGSKADARKLAARAALAYENAASYEFHDENAVAASHISHDVGPSPLGAHVPHSIYQNTGPRLSLNLQTLDRRMPIVNHVQPYPMVQASPMSSDSNFMSPTVARYPAIANWPFYIKPLPPRIGIDEISYLEKKGALAVPPTELRNELLRAYVEFVHPFMPLLDLFEFLMIIENGDGAMGRISLILFQAVMFAGSAFIDMQHLHNAGYLSRKAARKDFFQKTRLLYDFDYESDRVSLVQALLLLTYYYETPDDQKDTWHWMGVATSVAHTIGLHRNPERSTMDVKRTRLWKRIWWSTYMRDRLIALGMRRPTRIKEEDYDVPMITLEDFELRAIPEEWTCIPADCTIARDVNKQRTLAIMCVEKAKLCLCISHVLSKQYCVLNNNQGMVNDRTTMMLLPKKLDPETCEVKACDDVLQRWQDELPPEAKHRNSFTGDSSIDLCRSLLHMIFFTTLSALHRPQVLPAAPRATPNSKSGFDLLECSRRNVRKAATAITSIAQAIDAAGLVKYLPTTGVTVLLPAIIIHLLDIKSPDEATRRSSLRGFCQCMEVMYKLRDIYAAADYSTAFLEAAIRKAGIHINSFSATPSSPPTSSGSMQASPRLSNPILSNGIPKLQPVTTVEELVDAGRRLDMPMPPPLRSALTPPPDPHQQPNHSQHALFATTATAVARSSGIGVTDEEVARRLESFLASTPPESDLASDTHPMDNAGLWDHHQNHTAIGSGLGPAAAAAAFDDYVGVSATSMDATSSPDSSAFTTPPTHMDEFASATDDGPATSSLDRPATATTGDAAAAAGEHEPSARDTDADDDADDAFSKMASAASTYQDFVDHDDFEALLNLDAAGEPAAAPAGGQSGAGKTAGAVADWAFDDGGVHGFTVDMDWLSLGAVVGRGEEGLGLN